MEFDLVLYHVEWHYPPPQGFPPLKLRLNFLYTMYASRSSSTEGQVENSDLYEIEHREMSFFAENALFSLPRESLEQEFTNAVVSAGVPPDIWDSVVDNLVSRWMSIAAYVEEERILEINVHIKLLLRNWDGDYNSLSRWLVGEADTDEERAVAESFEEREFHGSPASEAAIEALERRKFFGIEKEGCTICLEDLEVESDILKMPCMHGFHEHCLLRWLKQAHVCPLCRYQLPKEM